MIEFRGRGILLDIEGTVAPISFVYDVLFPYARRQVPEFLATRWEEPRICAVRRQIAADAGAAEFSREALVAHVLDLIDRDAKATGLKELQGLIWADGYAAGNLRSTLFPDVAPALRRWRALRLDIRIYSSGSVDAQRVFFAYTEAGDLTPLLSGHYDTRIGKKQDVASYAAIAREFALPPAEILFASDVPEELDAAADSGMQTILTRRPGNRPASAGGHAEVQTFDDLLVVGSK